MKRTTLALFLRVSVILVIVLSYLAVLPTSSTKAATPTPPLPSLVLSPNSGPAGTSFSATLNNIPVGASAYAVDFIYDGVTKNAMPSSGAASVGFTASGAPNQYTVVAIMYVTMGIEYGRVANLFTVLPPPTAIPTATSSATATATTPPSPTPTPTNTSQPTPSATQVINQPQPNMAPPTPTMIPAGVVLGRLTPDQGTVVDGYKEGVKLTFPAGAVNTPVSLNYSVVNNLPGGAPPAGDTRLYFSMEARNDRGELVTQFNADFEICAQNATGIMFFDGQKWVSLPVTPGANGGVCAKLNHFTLFAVVVGATPTPVTGGAPGAAGPVPAGTAAPTTASPPAALPKEASTAVALPPKTAATGTVPARLPSTGGQVPVLAFFVLAGILFGAGVLLRRRMRV